MMLLQGRERPGDETHGFPVQLINRSVDYLLKLCRPGHGLLSWLLCVQARSSAELGRAAEVWDLTDRVCVASRGRSIMPDQGAIGM